MEMYASAYGVHRNYSAFILTYQNAYYTSTTTDINLLVPYILRGYQKYRYSYYIEILGACKEILFISSWSTKSALHVSIMEILITGYFHMKHFD